MSKKNIIWGLIIFLLVGLLIPWQATVFLLLPTYLLWKITIPKKPRPVASGNLIAFFVALSIWFVVAYYLADAVGL